MIFAILNSHSPPFFSFNDCECIALLYDFLFSLWKENDEFCLSYRFYLQETEKERSRKKNASDAYAL